MLLFSHGMIQVSYQPDDDGDLNVVSVWGMPVHRQQVFDVLENHPRRDEMLWLPYMTKLAHEHFSSWRTYNHWTFWSDLVAFWLNVRHYQNVQREMHAWAESFEPEEAEMTL